MKTTNRINWGPFWLIINSNFLPFIMTTFVFQYSAKALIIRFFLSLEKMLYLRQIDVVTKWGYFLAYAILDLIVFWWSDNSRYFLNPSISLLFIGAWSPLKTTIPGSNPSRIIPNVHPFNDFQDCVIIVI